MPTYNSETTVIKSIQSVIDQTYENWELLITDDGSKDNTTEVIKQFDDNRIYLIILEKNQGAGAARNNCIQRANGRYVAFLDSDDLWKSDKLEKQIAVMKEKNYSFTYTYYQKFSSERVGAIIKSPPSVSYEELLYSNCIGCLTAIYDQIELGKQYMPTIRKRQDMALWLTLLKITKRAYCIKENLAYYRTDSGMTVNKLSAAKAQWHLYKQVLGLSTISSIKRLLVYALFGLIKKLK